jgi:hypothetical protein
MSDWSSRSNRRWLVCAAAAVLLVQTGAVRAQDLDPRRWSHLPIDMNYVGAGYAYTRADITFDPVLELENVEMDMHTVAAKYIRTFALLNRSARIELAAPWQDAEWTGLLQGEPAATARSGMGDPAIRFAVNLLGAPPLPREKFAAYRAATPQETIVGAGLTVQTPLGQYYEDKLLNLGENRYTLRPELGMERRQGKWLAELTGHVSFFTDNDDFWKGYRREQAPMFVGQTIVSYTFKPGLWMGTGIAYGQGGESTINGTSKDDEKKNLLSGLVLGVPVNRRTGLKFAYFHNQARAATGVNFDTLTGAVSMLW